MKVRLIIYIINEYFSFSNENRYSIKRFCEASNVILLTLTKPDEFLGQTNSTAGVNHRLLH